MKKFLKTIISFIIMVLLMAAIAIFGFAIYIDLSGGEISDIKHVANSIIMDLTTNTEETTSKYQNLEIKEKYYYNQLSNNQKTIYNGLYQNKDNMMDGKYEIQYGETFSSLLEEIDGQKQLSFDYQSAVEAFLYDNPDVFYIDANKLYLNIEKTTRLLKTKYNVYVGPQENSTYYAKGFDSKEQVQIAKDKIEKVKEEVIGNLSGNSYKKIMKIHDYLVDTIDYDEEYTSIGSYSIYGALIDKTCVCEGYTKALKYLLNAAGIQCEMVQGTGTNSTGSTESHAWNCVYLEDKWYYIDTTWDDPIVIGNGTLAKSVQYRYFLKGTNLMNKDHTLLYQFSEEGKVFSYPDVGEKDY